MWHDIVNFLMQPFWIPLTQAAIFLVCGYAILAGTWRERFGGIIYLVGYLIPWFTVTYLSRTYIVMMLVADVLCLPGFIAINRKSPYAWTLWALIFQGLSVVADITDIVLFGVRFPPVYVITEGVLAYCVLASLLAGTVSAQLRRRHGVTGTARD